MTYAVPGGPLIHGIRHRNGPTPGWRRTDLFDALVRPRIAGGSGGMPGSDSTFFKLLSR